MLSVVIIVIATYYHGVAGAFIALGVMWAINYASQSMRLGKLF